MDHFIETVRKYPCLWNANAIEYRDQELKDAAWAEVMKETDLSSVKEVKLKWKKLRDSYRDALKRQSEMLARDPSNQSKKSYPWKYMGLMQFLQPYMNIRKKQAEVASAAHASNGHAAAEPPSSSESSSGGESACAAPQPKRRRSSERLGRVEFRRDVSSQGRGRRRRLGPPPAVPPARGAARREAAAAPFALALPPDPLDIFFNSMCQSTKRFPFQTQIKIKRTLFEAVIQAEEALLAEHQGYAGLWARDARAGASSPSSEPDEQPA